MRTVSLVQGATLAALACACAREFAVPPPPPPASLAGRVVVAEAGTGRRLPVAGVHIEFLMTNLAARTNEDGRFALSPIPGDDAVLSLRHDADGDGHFERQRVIPFATLAAGRRTGAIEAGELALGENAFIRGRVTLSDAADPAAGHGGILVFVPGSPHAAVTGDNGQFVLRDLPEGQVDLAAARPGYAAAGVSGVRLTAGQVLDLRELALVPEPAPQPASVSGEIVRLDGGRTEGTQVRLVQTEVPPDSPDRVVAEATTGADGKYSMFGVESGVYHMEVQPPDATATTVYNVYLASGASVELGAVGLAAGQAEAAAPGTPGEETIAPGNRKPVAKAKDLTVEAGTVARLDGSGSSDPDGDALVFTWVQTFGPTVALDINDSKLADRPVFTALLAGDKLEFELTVTDPLGAADSARAAVRVYHRPVAVVADSVVLAPNSAGQLDASASYDPDASGALTFSWEVVTKDAGGAPLITLSDATSPKPTFTAPASAGVVVEVHLTVSDGEFASDPATVFVITSGAPFPPKAAAGPDRVLDWGETTVLDPAGSSDPNGNIRNYYWTFPDPAPCGTLGGVAGSGQSQLAGGKATYTAPMAACTVRIRLRVDDTTNLDNSDELEIRVTDLSDAQVTSHEPASATGAPAFGPVSVTFARDVDATTVAGALVVEGAGGTAVAGESRYDLTTRTLSFVPDLPFEAGVTYTARLSGVRSTTGRPLAGGTYSFSFSTEGPRLQAETTADTSGSQHVVGAAGVGERMVVYQVRGNCPNIVRLSTFGKNVLQVCSIGGSHVVPVPQRIEETARQVNGRFWFTRRLSTCTNGATMAVARITGHRGDSGSGWFNLTYTTGSTYPGTNCSVTHWGTSTVDQSDEQVQAALVDSVESNPGSGVRDALAVRFFRCDACRDAVDGGTQPPPSAWIEETPLAGPTKTVTLQAVTADAKGLRTAVVWVADEGAGLKLRGALLNRAGGGWTPLPGRSGADLNAQGTADLPVVRWSRGGKLYLAYLRTDTPLRELHVQVYDGTAWSDLGGSLDSEAVALQRPSLALVQESIWIGYAAPAGSDQYPRVKWFDPRAGAWAAPLGAGVNGEIPRPTGCPVDRPFLSALPAGTGVMASYNLDCATSPTVAFRDVR